MIELKKTGFTKVGMAGENLAVTAFALSRVGCPYIMGATGQPCTVKYREARAKQYPGSAGNIKKYCPRMRGSAASCKSCKYYDAAAGKGKPAYDCAQLARAAMRQIGISLVSGSNSQWAKTPYAVRGEIAHMPRDAVCLVFRRDDDGKMGHVGVYLGDGTVVHARGHAYGVEHAPLEDTSFTHYMVPDGLSGDIQMEVTNMETIRQGSRSGLVTTLQRYLDALGYTCGQADGIFGAKTRDAVTAYQAAKGLDTDGIVGTATWTALEDDIAKMDGTALDTDASDEMEAGADVRPVTREEFNALNTKIGELTERFDAFLSALNAH